MNKNIEKELKILVSKDKFYTLYEHYNNPVFIEQTNIYFDTTDYQIKNCKGAMRIRTKKGKHLFTLKMYQNDDLLEYECEVSGNDVSALQIDAIQTLLHEYGIKGTLIPIASLTTKRAIISNEYAELCFDINKYNNQTDYEIEYEYKKDHDGITYFNQILSHIQMQYENNCESKIQRALSY